MKDKDIAIYVENVTKEFKLGVLDGRSFRQDLKNSIRGQKETRNILTAVDDMSFVIEKGERIGLIGKNGAGKSTLLKMICRITAPTAGFIGHNGHIASILEIGTGFHHELTGRENVYLSGSLLGMKKETIKSRFDEIVTFAEMEPFIDTPVKRYSSGMLMKLAFAVSSHLDAETLIMDEVLAVGDIDFQKKCIARLKQLQADQQRAIIYVSHNMDTISELCSRCLVMEKGKLIYDGDVDNALEIYRQNEMSGDDVET